MKDNTKITLTVGQLRRLVRESDWNRFVKQCNVEFMLTPEIKKAVEKYVMFRWKARTGQKDILSSREIYDLVKFLKDKDILVGDDDVRIGEKKVAEIERNYSSHRHNLEYKELKPKVRWLGIDLDLKPIDPDALMRDSDTVSEDEEGEPEKYIDDWLMPDQLTDDEFTDFTYFVDDKTGTEAYSRYEKKMPESLFNELYDMWLTEWEKEHNQKPYKDRADEDPFEGL